MPRQTPPRILPTSPSDEDFLDYADETPVTNDEQRRARARAARARDLRDSHWHVRTCARGHVIETHRTLDNNARAVRCPICGLSAITETPDQTAEREDAAFHTPLAILARAYDAMMEWGQRHLDAHAWTRKSEELRERANTRGDVFANWKPRR